MINRGAQYGRNYSMIPTGGYYMIQVSVFRGIGCQKYGVALRAASASRG